MAAATNWSQRFATVLRESFSAWMDDDAPTLGASLSYYTALSLAPLAVLVVMIVGLAFGAEAAQGQIVAQVQSLMGYDGAKTIENAIRSASKPETGLVASALALVTLLFGASGAFSALRSSLHKIWDIQPKSTSGLWGLIRERLLSFGMVLAVGFLLIVSLAVSAALMAVTTFLNGLLPVAPWILSVFNFVVSLAGITVAFALIYRFVPDARMGWRDVGIGAFVTALLFTIGKTLIGIYLGTAGVGSAYGAAGSLVVVLVWVYYSAQVFLLGAEFTHLWARHAGRQAQPRWSEEAERAEEPAPGFHQPARL
jgi:membrane protein